MKTQLILFGHGRAEPSVLSVDDDADSHRLVGAIGEHLGLPSADHKDLEVAVVDEDEPLRGDAVRDLLCGHRPKHIFAGRCRHAAVTVSFNGTLKDDRFPPAAKVSRVLKWAIKQFGISASDAPKMELRIDENGAGLPTDKPIGAFVQPAECSIKLFLVNKETWNG